MKDIVDRFLKYASFDTEADENSLNTPSSEGQRTFAYFLRDELLSMGINDAQVDEYGYLYATIPSNIDYDVPTIGFIAHLDTSPDLTGKNVQPRIVENYKGGEIILNDKYTLSPKQFPELKKHIGDDIIVTDGNTLLGADDKAGVAEIISAAEYLLEHPEIKHGNIRIAFTPDEEIGRGADNFDIERFGCQWAYTMDGGDLGELEYENFNAAAATIVFHGRNVHPGAAKNKMINSIRVANRFISMLPSHSTPEHTEDYEGFYHIINFEGTVEKTSIEYIIRDHSREMFESRKKELTHLVRKINSEYGEGMAEIKMHDQYYNMCEKIKPVMHIVEQAKRSMEELDITPIVKPIRGGTDGAGLSFKGLPCPNIFAGGMNFHGRYEYLPVGNLYKAMKTIIMICKNNI